MHVLRNKISCEKDLDLGPLLVLYGPASLNIKSIDKADLFVENFMSFLNRLEVDEE